MQRRIKRDELTTLGKVRGGYRCRTGGAVITTDNRACAPAGADASLRGTPHPAAEPAASIAFPRPFHLHHRMVDANYVQPQGSDGQVRLPPPPLWTAHREGCAPIGFGECRATIQPAVI